MLFVRTRIFVFREFGILCCSLRTKLPNLRTKIFYSAEDLLSNTKILKSLYEDIFIRPKIFLIVRRFFCSGENVFYSCEIFYSDEVRIKNLFVRIKFCSYE